MDEEEFYRERDSRTLRLTERDDYRNKSILVNIENDCASSYNGQIMLLTSLNLISRFCRNIDLICPTNIEPIYIPKKFKYGHLEDSMISMLEEIDPYGSFSLVSQSSDDYNAVLSIDCYDIQAQNNVTINSDGWQSYVGRKMRDAKKPTPLENPIGAGVASCLGASEVFKIIMGLPRSYPNQSNYLFSALNYNSNSSVLANPIFPNLLSTQTIHVAGLGAVGNAMAYMLSLCPIRGTVMLIDFDAVDISNLNRYLVCYHTDVGKGKIDVIHNYLSYQEGLIVKPFNGHFNEYVDKKGGENLELIFLSVDNDEGRHQVQWSMPSIVLNGTTGGWTFTIGRHLGLIDDCLFCRYPASDRIQKQNQECGIAGLNTAAVKNGQNNGRLSKNISAAVSFVSAITGFLVVAELVKMNMEGFPYTNNFFQADMETSLNRAIHFGRRRRKDCICSEPWFRRTYESSVKKSTTYEKLLQKIGSKVCDSFLTSRGTR